MFERKSADKREWVERKMPPPKPVRVSSVRKPAPPPLPRVDDVASPPLPPPPPPITENSFDDTYIYEVPCAVDKKKLKKMKKSSENLSKAPKKKPAPPPPPPALVSYKRPPPPIPAKPPKSDVYQDIANQVMSAQTPDKCGDNADAPMLLKTPAGTFLVTKINGPIQEISESSNF
jgi:hypothetical protein